MKSFEHFDGVKSRTVFCLWTGQEQMSDNRLRALFSIFNNTGCPVAYINHSNIHNWIKPEFPLHAAYDYLSSTHKSDYLRCYLMHHYGGGYTDVKLTAKNWPSFFDKLESSPYLALGYRELEHGLPHMDTNENRHIKNAYKDIIGLCAFIFKKNTLITKNWYDRTHIILDHKLPLLIKHPSQHPLDQTGVTLPDGKISEYPLRWAELLGEIFHPIIYQYRDFIIQDTIEPIFANYR